MNALKRWITCIFILASSLPVFAGETRYITEIEAVHLLERALYYDHGGIRIQVTKTDPATVHNEPSLIIDAKSGQDGYRATVNTRTARVMYISKNGAPFYEWKGIIVVGHRGHVKYAPENTFPAFEKGIEYGVDLLEIDVRETKDGELVVIHDETVDRTTNGTGKVVDFTLKEIQELDAGSWFDPKFAGTKVPTLREALRAMKGKALPDIDFKAGTPAKLVKILDEEGLLGKITLYCGNWELMKETMSLTDGFKRRPTVEIGVIGLPILLKELDPPIVNIDWVQFSERLVREVHLAGRKSFVNTMQHDTEWAILKAIDTMPDYIQSDEIDVLMPLLRAKGLHK